MIWLLLRCVCLSTINGYAVACRLDNLKMHTVVIVSLLTESRRYGRSIHRT